jgi:hypothetical protein
MNDREARRVAIAEAVAALRRGDDDGALVLFARLAGSSRSSLRGSILDLAEADTEMLRTMAGCDPDQDLLVVLVDDEAAESVTIDAAEPPRRTAMRVLLAILAGHLEDAELQLDLADEAVDPTTTGQVFVYALGRTMKLLDACVATEQPVPDWLRPVLTWS